MNPSTNEPAKKPFHSYAGGLPPTPGYFATERSVDKDGTVIRIGDIITDAQFGRGVVVGIFGGLVVYLTDIELNVCGVNSLEPCNASDSKIIGHCYRVLEEVARLEAADVDC